MEKIFYNALNIATESNYHKLDSLKKKHKTWKNSWENFGALVGINNVNPEKEWVKLEKLGIKLTLFEDAEYPKILKEIPWPPFGLYSLGDLSDQSSHPIAIVGTRKATESGRELAEKFAYELSRVGISIISGLAIGIDTASHKGALKGGGKTIAVLASGLDSIYPRLNEKLGRDIISKGGAVISEYPAGSPALPYRFLERNRIVSGLSRGVVVIEAPNRSGSLATARFATDQNRDVFVVPGPINHPNFSGSHSLIRSGAILVTNTEEILEVTDPLLSQKNNSQFSFNCEANGDNKIIMEVLVKSETPVTIDKIAELTNLSAKTINQTISFLIISNTVEETPTGYSVI